MSVAPADTHKRHTSSLRAPALVGAAGLGLAAMLHFHDPHGSGAYGFCPFLVLTGRPCPGCGGLRAVNDLTRGDLAGAISSNVMAVALVAVLGVAWVVWVVRRTRNARARLIALDMTRGAWIIVVVVAFGVVRNTPWGSWLAP